MNTGVFVAFRRNLTVTFDGTLTVVKLKTWRPLAWIGCPGSGSRKGTVTTHGEPFVQFPITVVPAGTWLGGLNGPSAPVLPLLMVWPCALMQTNKTSRVSVIDFITSPFCAGS